MPGARHFGGAVVPIFFFNLASLFFLSKFHIYIDVKNLSLDPELCDVAYDAEVIHLNIKGYSSEVGSQDCCGWRCDTNVAKARHHNSRRQSLAPLSTAPSLDDTNRDAKL